MIITVAHTKGGVGKSTLAWHLAHSFYGENVTIIDLDFQQTLKFVNVMSGNSLRILQPKDINTLLETLDAIKPDDICIIDVGGFDSDINRTAIEHSDKVLIPISDSVTEVLGFKTFENILNELDTDAELNIVLNNIHPLTKNFDVIKKAVEKYKPKLMFLANPMGVGNSIFGVLNNSVAKEEINGVRDELKCNN